MSQEIKAPQPAQRPAFFAAPCRVDGARVYDAAGDLVATVAYRRNTAEEAQAAGLIAAAPELLDFLAEYIEAWNNGMAGDSSLLCTAELLRAKVTGAQA